MSKIQKSCVTRRSKNIVKTNVQLKIDIWPQRRAHSVNVWIETLCWEHNTVVENAANTISICHCIYTWSIMTHHTQASKVFKWRKKCWLLLKAKQANIAVKHDKQSKPVGFRGGSKYIYMYIWTSWKKTAIFSGLWYATCFQNTWVFVSANSNSRTGTGRPNVATSPPSWAAPWFHWRRRRGKQALEMDGWSKGVTLPSGNLT